MANITSQMVKELREMTQAGMMDCKKALVEAEGVMEKAVEWLREKGLAAAAKKAGRIAAEGAVIDYVTEDKTVGAIVEVNCETDFVANTPDFKEMVETIAKTIIVSNPADVDALLTCKVAGDDIQTVSEMITGKVAKIGEKMTVRRFVRYEAEGGLVESYIHMGGKVGVLLKATGENTETVHEVLHDVALQIAAASPVAAEYVTRDQVRADHLEHEKEILIAQARNEGKPEKIIEKMVTGRINKFYQEVCLMEQPFVKDPDMSVEKMINAKAPGTKIVAFTRYKMGDGLEKKVNDLAAEVAEQIGK